MEHDVYSFEISHQEAFGAFEGLTPQDRNVIVDPIEAGNWSRQYERLHVGDIAVSGQVIVYYEQGSDTGIATLKKTEATDGMYGWNLSTVSLKNSEPTPQGKYDNVTILTATPEGFLNRHCYIEPGQELLVDGPRTISIGTIASVHAIEPRGQLEIMRRQPQTFRTRLLTFWAEHRPFAKAA